MPLRVVRESPLVLAVFTLSLSSACSSLPWRGERSQETATTTMDSTVQKRESSNRGSQVLDVRPHYIARYDDETNELRFIAQFREPRSSSRKPSPIPVALKVDRESLELSSDDSQCPSEPCYVLTKSVAPNELKESYTLEVGDPGIAAKEDIRMPKPVDLSTSLSTLITTRPDPLRVSWEPFTPASDEDLAVVINLQERVKSFPVSADRAMAGSMEIPGHDLADLSSGIVTLRFQRKYRT